MYQCHTPAALSRAYLKKPFEDQQSMQQHHLHAPRISQKFALE